MQEADYFTYADERGMEVSFPLGGIGAGCIGLSASGRLIDWEIANRPDKGSINGFSHFAIRAERDGKVLDARILNGPFHGNRAGDRGAGTHREFGFGVRREYLTGLPHFRECHFNGFFPTAELSFRDSAFPGAVEMLAFSPFVPMDERASGMPVAMFEVAVTNTTAQPLRYSLVGCIGNPAKGQHAARVVQAGAVAGMVNGARDASPEARDYGEVMLATDGPDPSWQHEWYRGSWFDSLEVYWKDLTTPGPFRDRRYSEAHVDARYVGGERYRPNSCLAAARDIAPGERGVFRFAIAWFFPNTGRDWTSKFSYASGAKDIPRSWRNFYAVMWPNVEQVVSETFAAWTRLRGQTLAFRDTLRASTLPAPVLDAVSANLSILKSPTVLRLEDGTFYGWEGCDATKGSCEGSCSHVWNYQQALPFLFPHLERSMRAADYANNLDPETGGMAYRLSLPLGIGRYETLPCADGQFGNVMKTYRDWKVSGDDEWLRAQWPAVKRTIEFAWHPGNRDRWDPSKTGVLTGKQHHTLDMELFGPNPWLTGFYLGALLAGAAIARYVGEAAAASEYELVFQRGQAALRELFNGEYFVQKIDVRDAAVLAAFEHDPAGHASTGSLRDLYWSEEFGEIKYQIGEGCLTDQAVAQWHADLYGLGDIFDRGQLRSALNAIYRLNFTERLGEVPNPCRVFGLENESGTITCAWPVGAARPANPGALFTGDVPRRRIRLRRGAHASWRDHAWRACLQGRARSLPRLQPQPVERDGVRVELRTLHGELCRAPRPFRLLVRHEHRPHRLRAACPVAGTIPLLLLGRDRLGRGPVRGRDFHPRDPRRITENSAAGLAAGEVAATLSVDGEPIAYERDGGDIVFAPMMLRAGSTLLIHADITLRALPDIDRLPC
ncbi:non-lysosomal glucosylceramidase [soil metagenome]